MRGEFGYWVFEGDWQPAQRPSWNYRKEDDGGIIVDMLCHWRYVLDNLFGSVKSVMCLGATHIPQRWDESGERVRRDGRRRRVRDVRARADGVIAQINSSWCTRVRRDDLATFHVDGTLGSAVAGLTECYLQPRAATPKPVWNPDVPQTIDFYDTWQKMPANRVYDNAFKAEWELFLRHVVEGGRSAGTCSKAPRACSSPSSACGAGPSAGCSTCRALDGLTPAMTRRSSCRAPTARSPRYTLRGNARGRSAAPRGRAWNRVAFAAAHVVADPRANVDPWLAAGRSTGTRRSRTAATCGRRASASPKRWTPRSAAWASTGRRRSS